MCFQPFKQGGVSEEGRRITVKMSYQLLVTGCVFVLVQFFARCPPKGHG